MLIPWILLQRDPVGASCDARLVIRRIGDRPRTGEILKGHVTLGSLRVRQDILIAEALSAPFVEGNEISERLHAMALERIRQLSAHEIGHTLGIAHNFSASVKDRASVMDYPHPLVSFENGKLDVTQGYAKGMAHGTRRLLNMVTVIFAVSMRQLNLLPS